jgi:uncharacterized protein (TIGR03083 family)
LVDAAETSMDRPVPSCPGWVGRDVVAHTGNVHRLIGDRVARGSTGPDDVERPVVPDGNAVLGWYRAGLNDLLATLASADPGKPVWNWSSIWPDTAAFWPRRMAHETSVHRVDAQQSAGAQLAIDTALAADGVDEFLMVHFAEDAGELTGTGETILLRTTDAASEWTVAAEPAGATVRTGGVGDATAVIEGGASDLVLLLWRRAPIAAATVSGDRGLAKRFLGTAILT